MFGIIGIVIVVVMVFGGYLAAGGKLDIILKALPFEMMIIGGAAVGAFVISNDLSSTKHVGHDMAKVFRGPKWTPDDYRDLLCLLFQLIRLARANPVDLEEHIEAPDQSPICLAGRGVHAPRSVCKVFRCQSRHRRSPRPSASCCPARRPVP